MGFLSLFGLKLFDPALFEKELGAIAQEISQTRNKMTVLGKRRRSSRKNIISYPGIIYTSWVIYRYSVALRNLGIYSQGQTRLGVFFKGQLVHTLLAIASVPIFIALVSYLVDRVFCYLIESQNKKLNVLVKKHKNKIQDLKNLSNYNTTNQLLEKYDDKPKSVQVQCENQPPLKLPQKKKLKPKSRASGPIDASKDFQSSLSSAFKPPKSIQDRVLDYIIGSDHNESVESRYALICVNCYTHNGLAAPGSTNPLETTYICRNCGFINGLQHLKVTNLRSVLPTVASENVSQSALENSVEGESASKEPSDTKEGKASETQ